MWEEFGVGVHSQLYHPVETPALLGFMGNSVVFLSTAVYRIESKHLLDFVAEK